MNPRTLNTIRDELAVIHAQKRHNGLTEIEVMPTGSYQGFQSGFNSATDLVFERIVWTLGKTFIQGTPGVSYTIELADWLTENKDKILNGGL